MSKQYIYRQIEVGIGAASGVAYCTRVASNPQGFIDWLRLDNNLDSEWRLAHVVPYQRNIGVGNGTAQYALYIFEQVVE